jgi:hypothetical protein
MSHVNFPYIWIAPFVRDCFLYQIIESFLSCDSPGKRAKGQLSREISASGPLAMESYSEKSTEEAKLMLGRIGQ